MSAMDQGNVRKSSFSPPHLGTEKKMIEPLHQSRLMQIHENVDVTVLELSVTYTVSKSVATGVGLTLVDIIG